MGYYTRYSLKIQINPTDMLYGSEDAIIAHLRRTNDYAQYTLSELGSPEESSKWYEHDADLKEFSMLYPTCLFILSGEGEESGDIWKSYIQNGKLQHVSAEIKFSDFDESKME